MKVRRVNDWQLEERLAAADGAVVVLFVASGTRALDLPRQEFARLASARPGAEFLEVDLRENPSLAGRYEISALPTTAVFVCDLELARHVGSPLEEPVGKVLGAGPPPGTFGAENFDVED